MNNEFIQHWSSFFKKSNMKLNKDNEESKNNNFIEYNSNNLKNKLLNKYININEEEEEQEFSKINKLNEIKSFENKIQNEKIENFLNDVIKRNEITKKNDFMEEEDEESENSLKKFIAIKNEKYIPSYLKNKEKINKNKEEENIINIFSEEEIENSKNNNLFLNKKHKRLIKTKNIIAPKQSDCPICTEKIKIWTEIKECNHFFCKNCIIPWSKKSTKCPLCKTNFKTIIIYDNNKKEEIKCKKRTYNILDENEEIINLHDNEENNICYICYKNDRKNDLMQCYKCKINFCHWNCADLDKINKKWICEDCKENDKEEKEIKKNIKSYLDF